MKSKWRFIVTNGLEGMENMAIDGAVLNQVSRGESPPTIRVYTWSPPAITIGYFQKPEIETDEEACRRDNIPVIRRITGGGAVFHDHELTYSIICPEDNKTVSGTVLESYKAICRPIISSLKSFSLNAEFSGINDIVVNGKKVSGNAQTRRMGCILQHGTLLLKVEPEKMFTYLNVPDVKIIKTGAEIPEARVTAMNNLIGDEVLEESWKDEFISRYREFCADDFKIDLEDGGLTDREMELVETYKKEIYGNTKWNKDREIPAKGLLS